MDYHSYLIAFITIFALLALVFWRARKFSKSFSQQSPSELLPDLEEELNLGLNEEEQELIQNIRDFQDSIVREEMIPRIDIVAVEESTNLKEFRQLAVEKGHSRIPVYHDTIDQVVGIAYVKDMLNYWDADDEESITVASFMRPPYFVPETKNIGALLHEFQAKKVHIAVAIDEYGGTAGIVTIEDLLEVVFGDIVDEHDEDEEELIRTIDENSFEVSAKADIDDLEELVGDLRIEQQDFDTVGGLLFSLLGDVPKEQESVNYQRLKFTVLKADRHRILQVKVERLPEAVEG
jgi:magnesium and cobalt transporter